MTPHRSNQRGSFRLDRRFGPVGRINRASGTTDADTFRRMDDMLTVLYETGQWDVLRCVRDGQLRPLEVWDAYRRGKLARLPDPEELLDLRVSVDRWLKGFEASAKHRDRYEGLFERLIEPKTTVRDLPALLRAFREQCQTEQHPRTFNIARAGCQAFLRDTFGTRHRLWEAIGTVPTLRVTSRRGRKLSVSKVADVAQALKRWAPEWWSLCLTGMRRGEYWDVNAKREGPYTGRWVLLEDRLVVHGTKTGAADRFLPRLGQIVQPRLGHWGFGQALRKASDGALRPHDARHTFSHWMELAGVPRIRRKLYLGHRTVRDVTELYEEHDVRGFLVDDEAKMREFMGRAPEQALRAV